MSETISASALEDHAVPPSDIIIAERIARLETKLDFVVEQLKATPHHQALYARVAKIETWQAKIGGVLLAVNIFFILMLDKLKNWIWPS